MRIKTPQHYCKLEHCDSLVVVVAHEGLVMSVESEVPVCVFVVSAMGGSGRILQHRPHVLHGVAVVQTGGGQLLTPLSIQTLNYSFYGQPLT